METRYTDEEELGRQVRAAMQSRALQVQRAPIPVLPSRRQSRFLPAALAAATVAALAVVTVGATHGFANHQAADAYGYRQSSPSKDGPVLTARQRRSLRVAAAFPAGYRLSSVVAQADGSQTAQVNTPTGVVELTVDPPGGAARRFGRAARPATVGGRPGYIGATWTDPQYDTDSGDIPTNELSWKYNDDAYVVLSPDYPGTTTLGLLRVLASYLDLAGTTPLRTPFAIKALPAGTRFDMLDESYNMTDPAATKKWQSSVWFDLDSSDRDAIQVALCTCGHAQAGTAHHSTATIGGRTAYIYPAANNGYSVEINEGGDLMLNVTSEHSDAGSWSGTLAQLLDIARDTTVAKHPDDPARWFDAAKAIP